MTMRRYDIPKILVWLLLLTACVVAWFLAGLWAVEEAEGRGLGKLRTVQRATAYCSPQPVALGGPWARWGDVAVPRGDWKLGRRLRLETPLTNPGGGTRRWFRARDTIGWGSQLDFYLTGVSEPTCGGFRRRIQYRVWFP